MRDTIFIGHANPEDNEFTHWLYAKLANEGYKVEGDFTLTGGESDYWKVLQDALDNRTCKYLLVLSKDTFKKQGVIDEWQQVRSIAAQNGLTDFILVCKIDEVPFNERIGLNVINHFRFDKSWAFGLKQLFLKLNKDNVYKSTATTLSLNDWIKNRHANISNLTKKSEKYYSNWLEIPELPEKLYIYQFQTRIQAKTIAEQIHDFPVITHEKYLLTFLESIPSTTPEHNFTIDASSKRYVLTETAFTRYEETSFPAYVDINRFLVRLLKDAIYKFFAGRNITFREMSQKVRCFYYKKDELENDKVFFNLESKKRWKQLIGDYDTKYKWHYGLSFKPILKPFPRFSMQSHLLFSDDGISVWSQTGKLHAARRKKGKSFYNAEWRDLMIAFINSLSNDGETIAIPMSPEFNLTTSAIPIVFESEYGFEEPVSKARLVPLDYYEDEFDNEEENESEDEDTTDTISQGAVS